MKSIREVLGILNWNKEACPICGKPYRKRIIAFEFTDEEFEVSYPDCKCEERAYYEALAEEDIREFQREVRAFFPSIGSCPEKRLEDFKPVPGTEKALAKAKAFLESPVRGIVFLGNIGAGKTHLMAGLHNVLKEGFKVLWFPMAFLSTGMKGWFEDGGIEARIGLMAEADFLFLDDIAGQRQLSDAQEEFLFNVVDRRVIGKKPILGTSQITDLNELGKRISERVLSRFLEICDFALLQAEDYRKKIFRGAK